MKPILTCLIAIISLSSCYYAAAQTSYPEQDCPYAKKILCDTLFKETRVYQGSGANYKEFPPRGDSAQGGASCFPAKTISITEKSAENNSVWYYFVPKDSGILEFVITSEGSDIDFVLFDLTRSPNYQKEDEDSIMYLCKDIFDNYDSMSVVCNSAAGSQPTGAKNDSLDRNRFTKSIIINKDHTYVMCINRFGGGGKFSFNFSGTTPSVFDPDCIPLNVSDPKQPSSKLLVFPNPATTLVNFNLKNQKEDFFKIKINDLLGNEVFSASHHNISTPLTISEFRKGLYIISLYGKNSYYSTLLNCQ